MPWGEAANNVQGLSQSSQEQGQHLQKRSLGAQEAALWQAPPVPLVSSGDADAGSASLESPALEDPTQPRAQLSKQAFLPRKLKELDGSPMAPRPGGGAAHTNAVGGGGVCNPNPLSAHCTCSGHRAWVQAQGGVLGTETRAPRTRARCYHPNQSRPLPHPQPCLCG